MARRSMLRASDAERERVVELLRHATGEGRLLAEELEQRLTAAFSARTYGELEALVADLPAERKGRGSTTPLWVKGAFALAVVMAVLAVTAMVALIALGLAGAWVAWVVLGWLFLGRRGRCVHRMGRSGRGVMAARGASAMRVSGGGR